MVWLLAVWLAGFLARLVAFALRPDLKGRRCGGGHGLSRQLQRSSGKCRENSKAAKFVIRGCVSFDDDEICDPSNLSDAAMGCERPAVGRGHAACGPGADISGTQTGSGRSSDNEMSGGSPSLQVQMHVWPDQTSLDACLCSTPFPMSCHPPSSHQRTATMNYRIQNQLSYASLRSLA